MQFYCPKAASQQPDDLKICNCSTFYINYWSILLIIKEDTSKLLYNSKKINLNWHFICLCVSTIVIYFRDTQYYQI